LIQAFDYVFEAGDKGMTFGASNSVHIQTIASKGMATKLFGQEHRVGCMLISIEGRRIIAETNALEIVQAHELQGCVLTLSVPPDDTITWITDVDEMTLPSVGPYHEILDSEPAKDQVQTSTTLIATGINGPRELTAPVASTNDFGCTTTSIVEQSRLPETGDCNI
jgi:hypothetical protein